MMGHSFLSCEEEEEEEEDVRAYISLSSLHRTV
jgi:hypothetical protein